MLNLAEPNGNIILSKCLRSLLEMIASMQQWDSKHLFKLVCSWARTFRKQVNLSGQILVAVLCCFGGDLWKFSLLQADIWIPQLEAPFGLFKHRGNQCEAQEKAD